LIHFYKRLSAISAAVKLNITELGLGRRNPELECRGA